MVRIAAVRPGGDDFAALGPGDGDQVPAFLLVAGRADNLHLADPVVRFPLVEDGGGGDALDAHFDSLGLHVVQGFHKLVSQLVVCHIMETCRGFGSVSARSRSDVAGATDGAENGQGIDYFLHSDEVTNNRRNCQRFIPAMRYGGPIFPIQSNFMAMYAQASASARAWWWFVRS